MPSKIEHTAARLKRELRNRIDTAYRESQQRFSREPLETLGVRAADIRRLAGAAAKEYRQAKLDIEDMFPTAQRLWSSGVLEERMLAVVILSKFQRHLDSSHWKRLDAWVDTLSNWAETDGLCTDLLAPLLRNEPVLVKRLKPWTRSRNRWRRRAAAVSLVPLARRGEEHAAAIEIFDRLAEDRDDLVEKAIGWLLKEISRTQPQEVSDYLLRNIDRLSRTTVRYACEKLPKRLRARVMSA
ncbi:MAG: DNA alkylation repair protein [Gemmatimonadota bacterium]|nr:MAG: DNA alkylation repair protein [Gemmatimonadota bacterium]